MLIRSVLTDFHSILISRQSCAASELLLHDNRGNIGGCHRCTSITRYDMRGRLGLV